MERLIRSKTCELQREGGTRVSGEGVQGWGHYPAREAAKSVPGRGSEPARAGKQDVVPSGKRGWLGACVHRQHQGVWV